MITSIRKVNYTIVELTKEDLFSLLLGNTIDDVSAKSHGGDVEPYVFRLYCSSPGDPNQLINHLKQIKESNAAGIYKAHEISD